MPNRDMCAVCWRCGILLVRVCVRACLPASASSSDMHQWCCFYVDGWVCQRYRRYELRMAFLIDVTGCENLAQPFERAYHDTHGSGSCSGHGCCRIMICIEYMQCTCKALEHTSVYFRYNRQACQGTELMGSSQSSHSYVLQFLADGCTCHGHLASQRHFPSTVFLPRASMWKMQAHKHLQIATSPTANGLYIVHKPFS